MKKIRVIIYKLEMENVASPKFVVTPWNQNANGNKLEEDGREVPSDLVSLADLVHAPRENAESGEE